MNADRPVILFLHNWPARIRLQRASHHWLAAQVGFRAFVVSWRNVRVSEHGTMIRGGFEILAQRRKRRIRRWEPVEPRVIVHRKLIWGRSEALLARLAEVHPESVLSYHPLWKAISRKWTAETCFRSGEKAGLEVARPVTYLIEKQDLAACLQAVGQTRPLIFKPSAGSQCWGIRLTNPKGFSRTVAELERSRWTRYVAQELVRQPLLYHGKKFDLRLYVLVTSFHPLRLKVYREGVARIAARHFDPARPIDGLRELTGCSYRKRRHVRIENVPVTEVVGYLAKQGYRVQDFWERVDTLVHDVFSCLANFAPLAQESDLARRIYLGGIDIMMVERGDSIQLLFLETNYLPQLNAWGVAVDRKLRAVHKSWLEDLRERCRRPS